jgi:hypothetical protein
MTQADDTDHLSQTTCMHLGAPCPALTKMLQALAAALSKARRLTDADLVTVFWAAAPGTAPLGLSPRMSVSGCFAMSPQRQTLPSWTCLPTRS